MMKSFVSRCLITSRVCNRTLCLERNIRSSFFKHQYLTRHEYSSFLSADRIPTALLNNAGVRSYLDKITSDDYSECMSKPNVTALIAAIRSLKVDLQSLNEFNTGHYLI